MDYTTSFITYVQYGVLALTAAIGIYGTIFEFKEDGKITKHAYGAISLILLLCLITIYLESLKSNQELLEAQAATVEAEKAEARLKEEQQALQSIQKKLDMAAAAIEQSTVALEVLNQESAVAARNLQVLTTPIEYISFGYGLRYENVDKLWPKYIANLKALVRECYPYDRDEFCEDAYYDLEDDDAVVSVRFYPSSDAFDFSDAETDESRFDYIKEAIEYERLTFDEKIERDKAKEYIPWASYKTKEDMPVRFNGDLSISFIGLHAPHTIALTESQTKEERHDAFNTFWRRSGRNLDLDFSSRNPSDLPQGRFDSADENEFKMYIEYLVKENAIIWHVNRPMMYLITDNLRISSITELLDPRRYDQHFLHFRKMLGHDPVLNHVEIFFTPSNRSSVYFDEPQIFKVTLGIEDGFGSSKTQDWFIRLGKSN